MTQKEIDDLLFEQAKQLLQKRAYSGKVYTDEQILFTASKLLDSEKIPEPYATIKKIAADERYRLDEGRRFYEQSKAAENFDEEGDYPADNTSSVYPSLSRMSVQQLRGYYSWRTKIRRGNIVRAPYSYITLYIAELMNLIGAPDADGAFDTLAGFIRSYSECDSYIMFQGLMWIKDFSVYYGINPEKYRAFMREIKGETGITGGLYDELCVLSAPDDYVDERLFDACCTLSSYKLSSSKWARQRPAEAIKLVCLCYRALYEKYKDTNRGILNLICPFIRKTAYSMRLGNFFYKSAPHPDCVYRLSPIDIYECKDGAWTHTGLELITPAYKSPDLGVILKTVDYYARLSDGIVPPLQLPPVRENHRKIIEKTVSDYHAEILAREKKIRLESIQIDRGLLHGIRQDSDINRERLMTDSERDAEITPQQPEEAPAREKPAQVFSQLQKGFLSLILSGGNLRAYAKENGTFVSALADGINEITLELLGDVAVEYDGDSAEITQDYITDVKELAGL